MCSYLIIVLLGLFEYHVTAESPRLGNILTGLHQQKQFHQKRQSDTEQPMDHEVSLTIYLPYINWTSQFPILGVSSVLFHFVVFFY